MEKPALDRAAKHLAARHRREALFRQLGLCAVLLACLILVSLLVLLVWQAVPGFRQARLELPIVTQLDGEDAHALLLRSLERQLPNMQGHAGRREALLMLSLSATQELKEQLQRHPRGDFTATLTASDRVDRLAKAAPDMRNALAGELHLSTRQWNWAKHWLADGSLRSQLNWRFFTMGDSREPELAGFGASIAGSLWLLLVCLGVSFPVAVATAIYLEEFKPVGKFVDVIEVNINNLAAVPSIVFGLLGLSIYLNLFGLPRSAPLVGGLTLALMILPTMIIATRAALKAVPPSIRDAARGLGASELQVVMHHTLPLALPGIMTGTILGLARAIGETAPLLMIGMVAFIVDPPQSPLDPATAMPVQIYLWANNPEVSYTEKTAAGIVVLLGVLMLFNATAIALRKRFEVRW